jgi:hypothetical protein
MFCLGCKDKYHFFKQCPKVRADYELQQKQKILKESLTNKLTAVSEALSELYLE